VFSMKGERVAGIAAAPFGAGSHSIALDRSHHLKGLPSGNYVYQFTFENSQGRFTQHKVMTVIK
jgi:hypothetical protein